MNSEMVYVVMYVKEGAINFVAAYTSLNDAKYMVKCLNKDPKIRAWYAEVKLYSRGLENGCCGKCVEENICCCKS